jgi:hypothetical protein
VTDRIPLAQHTKASLDQLYEDLGRAEAELRRYAEADSADAAAGSYALRAEGVEAQLARVTALCEQWVKAGPPPLGVSVARWWDARLVELHAAIRPPADESERTTPDNPPTSSDPHVYLSTGCYHKDHAYCQSMTGLNGAKRPASCKKCGARCICPCHQQTEPLVHIGGRANAEDCPACTGTNPDYPFICPGPDAEQPARTTVKNPAGA